MELYQQRSAEMLQQSTDEEQQLQQQLAQLEVVVKQMMTPQALQRYGTIKLAHPEKALQALVVIAQMAQAGNIGIIDDTQLKNVLLHITPQKKETKIKLHGAI